MSCGGGDKVGARMTDRSMRPALGRRVMARLLAVLVLHLCLAVPAQGEEGAPVDGPSMGPCMGEEGFRKAWMDRAHAYITRTLCQPSVWFDNFFGDHRAGEEWPGSLVRWRGSYRLDELEDDIYSYELDASFRLPKMSKRLKIIINSESREDPTTTHPEDNPLDLEAPDALDQGKRTTAGLRYDLADSSRLRLHVGGGARLSSPPDPYVRTRLRFTEPLGASSLLRLTSSAIWYRDEGLRRSLRLELDRRLGEDTLFRAAQSGLWREGVAGIQWGTSLSLFQRLTQKTTMALEAGARGNTRPYTFTERYNLTARLRVNLPRRWLFFELEPELYWPRDEGGGYRRYHALTFTLEIQFFS